MTASDSKQPDRLIIFVKAPRPGTVKTRLAQALGPEAACAAYGRLVAALMRNLSPLDPVELRFAPDEAEGEVLPWKRSGWSSRPQGPGALGQRMAFAFREAFESGARRVVLIGSDCPEVTPDDVRSAWLELDRHDLVLGPASDGGYWLIGLRACQEGLFAGIAWSQPNVLQLTLQKARELSLRVRLLRELSDVDTAEDWMRVERSVCPPQSRVWGDEGGCDQGLTP